MKLYAGFIRAERQIENGVSTATTPFATFAGNLDEARGRAIAASRNHFAANDGWYNHGGDVMELPTEAIRENLAL